MVEHMELYSHYVKAVLVTAYPIGVNSYISTEGGPEVKGLFIFFNTHLPVAYSPYCRPSADSRPPVRVRNEAIEKYGACGRLLAARDSEVHPLLGGI